MADVPRESPGMYLVQAQTHPEQVPAVPISCAGYPGSLHVLQFLFLLLQED